jgi:hypothetical protein
VHAHAQEAVDLRSDPEPDELQGEVEIPLEVVGELFLSSSRYGSHVSYHFPTSLLLRVVIHVDTTGINQLWPVYGLTTCRHNCD